MRGSIVIGVVLGVSGCGDDGGGGGDATESASSGTTASGSPSTTPTGEPTGAPDSSTAGPTTDGPTTASTTGDPDTGSSDSTGPGLGCPYDEVPGTPDVALEVVADGFVEAVLAVGDPLEQRVLYVLEKPGRVKRIEPGVDTAPAQDWLALPVVENYEAGLLSMAFHPAFENDPRLFVVHTRAGEGGDSFLTEFQVNDGVVDTDSARDIIGIPQPANHYAGMIAFGADGMLYMSIGDGGPQGDPCNNGQDTTTMWGKMLRLNPDADGTPDAFPGCGGGCNCPEPAGDFDYTIPDDNPFVDDPTVLDEIYAIGFRNPWRFSIDPVDDRIWVGDVGWDGWEEVDVVEAGGNYGWADMEGFHCNNLDGCDEAAGPGQVSTDGLTMPVLEYPIVGGACSVIALGNYRSCEVPGWHGRFFYADNCTGEVFAVAFDGTDVEDLGIVGTVAPDTINGGGYNEYGDVFVASAGFLGEGPAPVYRIAPAR